MRVDFICAERFSEERQEAHFEGMGCSCSKGGSSKTITPNGVGVYNGEGRPSKVRREAASLRLSIGSIESEM